MEQLNYNENTNHVSHWDLEQKKFHSINDFIQNCPSKRFTIYILGPYNLHKMRYMWLFEFVIIGKNINIHSIKQNLNQDDSCMRIQIINQNGKINYIYKCEPYTGKDIIIWSIQILKSIGVKNVILIDDARKICESQRFKNYTISLSLIHKLWKNSTYYEIFGFIPFHKNNNNYKNSQINKLDEIIQQIKLIQWEEIKVLSFYKDTWNYFTQLYKPYYILYPFCAFQEFLPEKCGLFYDILIIAIYHLQESKAKDLFHQANQIIHKSVWKLNLDSIE